VIALKRSVLKQFATVDLGQVFGCPNRTMAPACSQMNKQVQVVLVNKVQLKHKLENKI
jgi:hypothetical protein